METPKNIIAIAFGITFVLTVLVLLQYKSISGRPGSLVIPAGNTYLGPNTPAPLVPWHEVHGRIYPYSFSVPETLTLKTFDGDPYDIYAISIPGIDPTSNVLIGVDNLKASVARSRYMTIPEIDYVRDWWQQFSGLKGVASIDPFTNSKGLKGYKARYMNAAGETPNTDIFFEVPGTREYVIHLANGTLDPSVFDKIVDSVSWTK